MNPSELRPFALRTCLLCMWALLFEDFYSVGEMAVIGFKNLGMSCFLNSVLQCFLNVETVHSLIMKYGSPRRSEQHFSLLSDLKDLCLQYSHMDKPLVPQSIYSNLRLLLPNWRPGREEDAHELLVAMLESISDEMKSKTSRKDTTSPLDQCANVSITFSVKCGVCSNYTTNTQTSSHIQLDIMGSSLDECLTFSFKKDKLTGNNQYHCQSCCKLVDATMQPTITGTSQLLIIQLKRFEYVNGNFLKQSSQVKCPETLYFNQINYHLSGFICHEGLSPHCGHYTTFLNNANCAEWTKISDEKVSQISKKDLVEPYILFYERKEGDFNSTINTPAIIIEKEKCLLADLRLEEGQDKNGGANTAADLKVLYLKLNRRQHKHSTLLPKPSSIWPAKKDIEGYLDQIKRADNTIFTKIIFPSSSNNAAKTISLTTEGIKCLQQRSDCSSSESVWLNDQVVNAYVMLLASSSQGNDVYPMNSFITHNWNVNAYRKDKLFEFTMWIAPIHLGAHWTMMVVDFKEKAVLYSDSINCTSGLSPIANMLSFMEKRFFKEHNCKFNWNNWKVSLCWDFPNQKNDYDCGIFSLKAAQYIIRKVHPNYNQEDIPRIRYEMLYELSNGILLPCTYRDPNNTTQSTVNKSLQSCQQVAKDLNQPPAKKLRLSLSKHQKTDPRAHSSVNTQTMNSHKKNAVQFLVQSSQSPYDTSVKENISEIILPDPATTSVPNYLPASPKKTALLPMKAHSSTKQECNKLHSSPSSLTPSLVKHEKQSPVDDSQNDKERGILQPLQNSSNAQKSSNVNKCTLCDRVYGSRSNLLKHTRTKHLEEFSTGKIHCQNCNFSCRVLNQLRHHLRAKHGKKMEAEHLVFDTMEDFQAWKDEFERDTDSQFVKATGQKKTAEENNTTYYYCNRSGYFRSHSQNIRHSKLQGSCKINAHCTASIVLTKKSYSNQIFVSAYKTHYGHSFSLGQIRLQATDRKAIAGKLAQGVKVQHILDTVRVSVNNKLERIHLITRKDIANIERTFGLQGSKRHPDDATSVELWVEELNNKADESPVLIYKQQGKPLKNLLANDFVLGLQTPLQAEMLKKFGHNIVCLDATHGTTGYDFSLISVIVVDEFGEGYPVAWCLSNRTDLSLLISFFNGIKKKCGSIVPKWIMTDDADQYYSAWVGVFGNGPNKLLCSWHVDRAWRGHLNSITDKTLAQTLYHNLRMLLEETDQHKFESALEKTVKQMSLSLKTKEFCQYFKSYYYNRKEQWASCYRKSAGINTNMYVESFHKVLKYLYLKGKTNKRVDKCLQVLLKYERDKGFERLIKLEKGKCSGRITAIMKRHQTSKKLSTALVSPVDDCTWKVKSSDSKNEYIVVNEAEECPSNCSVKCADCNVCIHMYYCNCMDATINHTICKHIHLVVRCNVRQDPTNSHHIAPGMESDEEVLILQALHHNQSSQQEVVQRILKRLSVLAIEISKCSDIDTLTASEKHIIAACNVCRVGCTSTKTFSSTENKYVPPNTKILPQRFTSTKSKQRKSTSIKLAKPTQQQKENIYSALSSQTLYQDKKVLREKIGWLCKSPESLQNSHLIEEVEVRDEALADEVLDNDVLSLKPHFSRDAWALVLEKLDEKKEEWKCHACTVVTATQNMIMCDHCSSWFHWSCVGLINPPQGDWYCTNCSCQTL